MESKAHEGVRRIEPTRCPFCHEGIDLEADAWLACSDCLARHHNDCWAELGSCASCRGAGRLEREGAGLAQPEEEDAQRGRGAIIALTMMMVVFSAGYRLLVLGRLEQSAALFIGLPMLLSIGLAFTPKAKSVTGMVVKGTTLALLLSGVLFGEGFICILMAAPIFYFVAIAIGLVIDALRRRAERTNNPDEPPQHKKPLKPVAVVLLLTLPMAFEGVSPGLSFGRDESVVVERVVELSEAEILEALAQPSPSLELPLPGFLQLGFPKPKEFRSTGIELGDLIRLRLAGSEGDGQLALRVRERGPRRLRWQFLLDTTPIAHWLKWTDSELSWEPLDGHRTRLRWRLSYRRLLDPQWYFAPLERFGVRCGAEALISGIEHEAGLAKSRSRAASPVAR